MISFLKQKDAKKWYVHHSGKVLAYCEVINNSLPLVSFTKHAINMLPSTIVLLSKGFELLKNPDCGETSKSSLLTDEGIVEIEKVFFLKFTSSHSVEGKGVAPLKESDYWKPV